MFSAVAKLTTVILKLIMYGGRGVPLKKHPMFAALDHLRSDVVPNMDIPPHKKAIKVILDVRIRHYHTKCMAATEVYMGKGIPTDQFLYDYIQELLYSCLVDAESELMGLGVPKEITTVFGNWHSRRIDLVNRLITGIVFNPLYKSHYEKGCRIFTLVQFALYLAIIDAAVNTSKINGGMDKYFNEYNTKRNAS